MTISYTHCSFDLEVMDSISRAFASVYTSVLDLDAGSSDRRVVVRAWRLFAGMFCDFHKCF